ncbi:MAG: 50S ribosomal protein L9 [Patescibacteria group bacterium]|nr:50S ribosomal protein L9 [bacterium]MDZ4227255.1 50S ribosomal protein L9 [Patescibacteria group bacterium]
MKVILLKDVAKTGQQGSVVEVSDGYAMNYLIPNGLAEQATADKLATYESVQQQKAEQHAQENKAMADTVKSVEGAVVEMKARATEKGGLFKAINAADISLAILNGKGAMIPANAIELQQPIKTIGEHELAVRAAGAEARITLSVSAENA